MPNSTSRQDLRVSFLNRVRVDVWTRGTRNEQEENKSSSKASLSSTPPYIHIHVHVLNISTSICTHRQLFTSMYSWISRSLLLVTKIFLVNLPPADLRIKVWLLLLQVPHRPPYLPAVPRIPIRLHKTKDRNWCAMKLKTSRTIA